MFEEDVLRLICLYDAQSGRCLEEKQSLNDELKDEWDVPSAGDLVVCLGGFNGHIGMHIDGFDGVDGGCGIGQRNFEGRMLLEFCLEKELCV